MVTDEAGIIHLCCNWNTYNVSSWSYFHGGQVQSTRDETTVEECAAGCMATRGCTGFEIESAWVQNHDESHGGRTTYYCAFWYERACSSYESPGAVMCARWTTYVMDLHRPPHPPTPPAAPPTMPLPPHAPDVCHRGLKPRTSRPQAGLLLTRVSRPWTDAAKAAAKAAKAKEAATADATAKVEAAKKAAAAAKK